MEPLRQTDFKGLIDFLHEIYAARDLDGFINQVLTGLHKLVPSDVIVYNEWNLRRRRVQWLTRPENFSFPGSERVFEDHASEHPIIKHYKRTRDDRAIRISDFFTQRQFHRTGLYNEFFKRMNLEHHISVRLQGATGLLIGVNCDRKRPDFTERDRLIFNLLSPHLVQAYRNAEAFYQMRKELAQVNHTLDILDQGIIILKKDGRVRLITERARRWLEDYFGKASGLGNHLPEGLLRWIKHQETMLGRQETFPHPRKPLVVEQGGRSLVVRLISEPDQSLLILEDRRTALKPEDLEPLGLSKREAEVLVWVGQGKTNAEIALILDTSPKTIEKHLERIFQKLGVESRTAAAMQAFALLSQQES